MTWQDYQIDAVRLDGTLDLISLCWTSVAGEASTRSDATTVRVLSDREFHRVVVAATVAERRHRRLGRSATVDLEALIARVLEI